MRKRPIPAPTTRDAPRAQMRAGGPPITYNQYKETPLHAAALTGMTFAVQVLLIRRPGVKVSSVFPPADKE